jgi:hypothetical protein
MIRREPGDTSGPAQPSWGDYAKELTLAYEAKAKEEEARKTWQAVNEKKYVLAQKMAIHIVRALSDKGTEPDTYLMVPTFKRSLRAYDLTRARLVMGRGYRQAGFDRYSGWSLASDLRRGLHDEDYPEEKRKFEAAGKGDQWKRSLQLYWGRLLTPEPVKVGDVKSNVLTYKGTATVDAVDRGDGFYERTMQASDIIPITVEPGRSPQPSLYLPFTIDEHHRNLVDFALDHDIERPDWYPE